MSMGDKKNSLPFHADSRLPAVRVKNEKTTAAIEKLRERNRRAAAVAEVFSGTDRNRLIRKFALVEYRCARGCLLGAVVRLEGEHYLLTYEHVSVGSLLSDTDHFAEWVTAELQKEEWASLRGEVYKPDFSKVPHDLEQTFRDEFAEWGEVSVLPVDEVPLATLIGAMSEHVSGVSSAGCQRFDPSPPGAEIKVVAREYMNCRHKEFNPTWDDIQDDIQRLRTQKNKTVRVATSGDKSV